MRARITPDYRELVSVLDGERVGRAVVLANGCFDVLHVGHVRLLAEARCLGDLLVVALNDDASARSLKGEGRPLVPLDERMEMVAALAGVDHVTSFREPSAEAIVAALRPDVHVKGTDWTEETVPERSTVVAGGGRVVIAGGPKAHSTTDLIRRIRSADPA